MGYPIVRYAIFSVIMMLGSHFLFQNLSQDVPHTLETIKKAVLMSSRSVDKTQWSSTGDEIIVPMKWEGVWVADVEINDLHEVRMIVDTGASMTALSAEAAFDIGLSQNSQEGTAMISTANGVVEEWMGRIHSIRLGEAEQRNVRVFVMKNFGGDERGGLLGLNFLNAYNWQIDQQAGHLILRPKT